MEYVTRPNQIQCPYCWEQIEIVIDHSIEKQSYFEDCSVCCCPIYIDVDLTDIEDARISIFRDDD